MKNKIISFDDYCNEDENSWDDIVNVVAKLSDKIEDTNDQDDSVNKEMTGSINSTISNIPAVKRTINNSIVAPSVVDSVTYIDGSIHVEEVILASPHGNYSGVILKSFKESEKNNTRRYKKMPESKEFLKTTKSRIDSPAEKMKSRSRSVSRKGKHEDDEGKSRSRSRSKSRSKSKGRSRSRSKSRSKSKGRSRSRSKSRSRSRSKSRSRKMSTTSDAKLSVKVAGQESGTVKLAKKSKSGKRRLSKAQKEALAKGRAALQEKREKTVERSKPETKSYSAKAGKASDKKDQEVRDGLWSFLNYH